MWDKIRMPPDLIEPAATGMVFLIAGAVKGGIGFGLPTVAMGLLGIWMPAAEAAALLALPAFVTNVWQALDGPHLAKLWRRLWPMLVTLAVFAVIGTAVITGARNAVTLCFLGAMLVLYGVLDLTGSGLVHRGRGEPGLGFAVGTTTGIVTGTTAVFVIPSALYIQALRLEKTEFTQAMGMMALTAAVGLSAGLAYHGHFDVSELALPAVGATAAGFAGMAGGRILRRRMPIETFRRGVLFGLMALGLVMILRSV